MISAETYRPRPSEGTRYTRLPGDIPKTFTPELEMKRASLVESNEDREKFLSYELMQMRTHLGERLNVNISGLDYDIKGGMLYGKDMDEPFLDSIVRGRDLRQKNGNPIDFERENAEVEGFTKIQELMTDPDVPVGTMMLSISPKGKEGSTYQHNFYDVFTIKVRNGKRYVEAKRYTSGLKVDDYRDKLSVFADIEIDDEDPAASLLANPIAIQNTLTPNDLHKYLHRDHEFTDENVFKAIAGLCDQIAQEYARCLIDEPYNLEKHKNLFNTYLNKADDLKRRMLVGEMDFVRGYEWSKDSVFRDMEVYQNRPVEVKMTGCGSSGGYEEGGTTNDSPFSVSEFGKSFKAEDDPNLCRCGGDKAHFHCPGEKDNKKCDNKIIVGKGITSCSMCGEGKKC